MPQLVYRIQKSRFVPTLLSGEGARLYGGRWNPEGIPLVYTSASPELAFLETLVHLDATPFSDLPPYVQITLSLPDGSVEIIPEVELPPYLDDLPSPDHVARFLQPRLQPDNPYLGFAVPSSVLPGSPSRNILLNPLHPLIKQVEILSVVPFVFDERLRPESIEQPSIAKSPIRTSAKRKPKL
jgi:RES domain-containing protein